MTWRFLRIFQDNLSSLVRIITLAVMRDTVRIHTEINAWNSWAVRIDGRCTLYNVHVLRASYSYYSILSNTIPSRIVQHAVTRESWKSKIAPPGAVTPVSNYKIKMSTFADSALVLAQAPHVATPLFVFCMQILWFAAWFIIPHGPNKILIKFVVKVNTIAFIVGHSYTPLVECRKGIRLRLQIFR